MRITCFIFTFLTINCEQIIKMCKSALFLSRLNSWTEAWSAYFCLFHKPKMHQKSNMNLFCQKWPRKWKSILCSTVTRLDCEYDYPFILRMWKECYQSTLCTTPPQYSQACKPHKCKILIKLIHKQILLYVDWTKVTYGTRRIRNRCRWRRWVRSPAGRW